MLTFPEVLSTDDVVVYPDDEDPNLFYLLPGKPRLRMDDGVPVFRALFWTDQADGGGGSVAGLRGALLNFDVDLEIPDDVRKKIEEQVRSSGFQEQRRQMLLEDERRRLEAQARAMGLDPTAVEPKVPAVGTLRFGSIRFTSGNVVLLEEKSGGFVEWSSAGGPPSLIGDNNAAFALRLGPEGAAVWYRALEQNATALGLRYELKFEARLPSLEIHIWAGVHEDITITRVIEQVDKGCGASDFDEQTVREVTQTLVQSGLVQIEIKKGSAKLTDEMVSQLRNTALSLISDRVREMLTHHVVGMTPEERGQQLIRFAKEQLDSFAELRLTQRDVVEWGVNPQATITSFLGKLSGDDRQRMMTLVDLSDPVAQTLEVPVTVSAPWTDDPPVTKVLVHVEYPNGGEDKVWEKGLEATHPSETVYFRRKKGDRGIVNYSAKAYLRGTGAPVALPSGKTNGAVHIEVPRLGVFAVRGRAHPEIFAQRGGAGKITSVELNYRYKADRAPDHVAGSIVIRPEDAQGVVISAQTGCAVDEPLHITPTYYRENYPEIKGSEVLVWMRAGRESMFEVQSPWHDYLQIGARVAPGIPNLSKVRVDIQYRDRHGDFSSDGTIVLDKDGDWEGRTQLVQLDKSVQDFRYRYTVTGPDQINQSSWIDAAGDQDLVLPLLAVRVRTDRLQLGTTYAQAVLRLHYEDPVHQLVCDQEFFLTKDTPQAVWLIPRVDGHLAAYKYSATLYPVGTGPSVEIVETESADTYLILTPPV